MSELRCATCNTLLKPRGGFGAYLAHQDLNGSGKWSPPCRSARPLAHGEDFLGSAPTSSWPPAGKKVPGDWRHWLGQDSLQGLLVPGFQGWTEPKGASAIILQIPKDAGRAGRAGLPVVRAGLGTAASEHPTVLVWEPLPCGWILPAPKLGGFLPSSPGLQNPSSSSPASS